jgi:hypothetical protein
VPIYLNPNLTTHEDAIANLYAFSVEGRRNQKLRNLPDAIAYTSAPRSRNCFGWMMVNGTELHALPSKIQPPRVALDRVTREIARNQEYFAILYEFIPKSESGVDIEVMQSQLDLLWLAGFCIPTQPKNWESGVLLDMADLICP